MSFQQNLPKTRSASQMATRSNNYLRPQAQKPIKTEIFPGLNDITDAFEALPLDIIRYFTLLKEIDAKCVSLVPQLNDRIKKFVKQSCNPELKEARTVQIREISQLIKDLLPCLEEKMHVASIAADKAVNYIDRINDDFELTFKNEIPDSVKYGAFNHPAIIIDTKLPDNKSVHSQRSESRREALAAKKAASNESNPEAGSFHTFRREATPSNDNASPVANNNTNNNANQKKRKTNSETPQEITRPSTPNSNKRRTTNKKKPNISNSSLGTAAVITKEEVSNSGISNELANADAQLEKRNDDELTYCYCNQVSYGEMVGCDGDDCKREWFHLPCTGLATLPKGKWYCDDCSSRMKKVRRS